jgi:predicted nucleic acid-binding protein
MQKVYIDTSVFGGVFDKEFDTPSRLFFQKAHEGVFNVVVSPVVEAELTEAPEKVKTFYRNSIGFCEKVIITDSALRLQEAYLKQKIVSSEWESDALHVAVATVCKCDMIVSWNFKHIVNYQKIPLYNAVNILHGYGQIAIYSPLEVVGNEK